MARLPFNPDLISPPKEPAKPEKGGKADRPLTVSQAAGLIKDALTRSFPSKIRIVGEVSNFNQRNHWYFSLKDAGASLRCVCFASAARKVNFPVSDGMEVVATGRIDFYDAQGSVQLYVDSLEPVGQGALEIKFRALCDELRRLGYFEEERKKRLPAMPCRVAVITSRTGAALQDVINTAARRWTGCELLLFDVRVQGAAAAPEVAAAIESVSRHGARLGVDAIILTRGGGSMEDLWAFNERVVADAIYRCSIPIVAAIGHEVDVTIAELVADLRCSTPTQAAMTLIPDRTKLAQQVDHLRARLATVLRRQSEMSKERLDAVARHAFFRRPERMLDGPRERVAELSGRLQSTLPRAIKAQEDEVSLLSRRLNAALPRRLKASSDSLAALSKQLNAVGPLNVLERGYSYTLGPDGKVLREPAQVKAGDRITSVLAKGKVASEVVGATNETLKRCEAPAVARLEKPAVKTGKAKVPSKEPGLFGE